MLAPESGNMFISADWVILCSGRHDDKMAGIPAHDFDDCYQQVNVFMGRSMVEVSNECICLVGRGFLVTYSDKVVENFALLTLFHPARAFC